MLNQSMYTNVTMGQFVEGIKMGDNVTFYSGLIANSTVTQAVRPSYLGLLPGCLL